MGYGRYGAVKTFVGNIAFPSKLEASVYKLLLTYENVTNIKLQDSVTVKEKCPTCGDGPINWKVDFSYIDSDTKQKVYVEAKGVEGHSYKLRKKLWKANPPGVLHVYKGSYKNPKLVETIGE